MANELQQLAKKDGSLLWVVGGKVLVETGGGNRYIETIGRITDGRDGTIYLVPRKPLAEGEKQESYDVGGYLRGGSMWNRCRCTPITPEQEIAFRHEFKVTAFRRRLAKADWTKVPDDEVEKIYTILRNYKNGAVEKV